MLLLRSVFTEKSIRSIPQNIFNNKSKPSEAFILYKTPKPLDLSLKFIGNDLEVKNGLMTFLYPTKW